MAMVTGVLVGLLLSVSGTGHENERLVGEDGVWFRLFVDLAWMGRTG